MCTFEDGVRAALRIVETISLDGPGATYNESRDEFRMRIDAGIRALLDDVPQNGYAERIANRPTWKGDPY